MHAKLIFACILHILHGYSNACPDDNYSFQIASNILEYSSQENVPADLIAAVCFDESHFDQYAKSPKGAIGIYQIKRKGAIQLPEDLKLSFHQLADIRVNTRIAVHYMGTLNVKCPGRSTWLTIYNTGHGQCRSSPYSRKINTDLKKGLKWEKKMFSARIAAGEYVITSP